MKNLGILGRNTTVFPRLESVPAWASLSDSDKKQSARKMELYAAMVEHLDHNVGKLIQYLKEKNLYDNTLFIFLSDNGPEGNSWNVGPPWDSSNFENWGKKGTFIQYGAAWAQVSAGPFRMFKGFQSEGGIRAPMIMAGRGVNGSGRISNALSHVMDIPATILSAARVSYPKTFQGREIAPIQGKSLMAVLNGSRPSVRGPKDWLGFEIFGNRAIRQDNWKLLWLCKPYGPGGWQLFDLKTDPGEMNDRSAAQPAIRAELIRRWAEYSRSNNVIIPNQSPICGKSD
jgi:arylsulfatase